MSSMDPIESVQTQELVFRKQCHTLIKRTSQCGTLSFKRYLHNKGCI